MEDYEKIPEADEALQSAVRRHPQVKECKGYLLSKVCYVAAGSVFAGILYKSFPQVSWILLLLLVIPIGASLLIDLLRLPVIKANAEKSIRTYGEANACAFAEALKNKELEKTHPELYAACHMGKLRKTAMLLFSAVTGSVLWFFINPLYALLLELAGIAMILGWAYNCKAEIDPDLGPFYQEIMGSSREPEKAPPQNEDGWETVVTKAS